MFLGEWFTLPTCKASKVDANQCTKCKGNLFMQTTLRKKQRIRTKPRKWAEIINHNLPKTENVWIFENCFRADIQDYSLAGCPWDLQSPKEGAALNKGKWRQISSGDTQNNKTQPRKQGKPLKRPNRNHQYTNETTKTRRLKQAKPPKQAKTSNRWKQAWLNYRMQGHSLPYYWITKAAIVICLVQQKVLTNLNVLALNSIWSLRKRLKLFILVVSFSC